MKSEAAMNRQERIVAAIREYFHNLRLGRYRAIVDTLHPEVRMLLRSPNVSGERIAYFGERRQIFDHFERYGDGRTIDDLEPNIVIPGRKSLVEWHSTHWDTSSRMLRRFRTETLLTFEHGRITEIDETSVLISATRPVADGCIPPEFSCGEQSAYGCQGQATRRKKRSGKVTVQVSYETADQ